MVHQASSSMHGFMYILWKDTHSTGYSLTIFDQGDTFQPHQKHEPSRITIIGKYFYFTLYTIIIMLIIINPILREIT